MPDTISIAVDQGPPTEPGWYICEHGDRRSLFEVVREDEENLCIMSMIGPVYSVLDYQSARWSRSLTIVSDAKDKTAF